MVAKRSLTLNQVNVELETNAAASGSPSRVETFPFNFSVHHRFAVSRISQINAAIWRVHKMD